MRSAPFVALLLMSCAPARAQQPQPQPMLTLTLPAADMQAIWDQMGELPWKRVNPLMVEMQRQWKAQMAPTAVPAPPEKPAEPAETPKDN